MTAEPMPEDLRRFILRSVPSIPFIEALLLFREHAGAEVAIETVARRLYIPQREAAGIVEQLQAARIIQPRDGGSIYAPDADLAPVLDVLARCYRTNLVEVTSVVHSRTGRMAQHFSDAFKLRKD